jgi:2-C-methyl-D-erythritol 4-phosphate cytidylyltransferase
VRKNRRADTAAIIVAGGKGLRFGGSIRKQYLLLNKKPIVWWSLRAFEKSPSIQTMALVVPVEDLSRIRVEAQRWKFKKLDAIIPGGATRAGSVSRGLSAIPAESRYVAVHDAVRPLVTPKIVENVIQAARQSKAAIAASPSKDTVKLANGDGCVHSTPAREKVWLAQTPQVFETKLLRRAHARAASRLATDDAMLVESLGIRVKLVESSAENMKVTVPMDLILARHILQERP